MTILASTSAFTFWCIGVGLKDELEARKAEKEAVARILFNQMDEDGSGSLDMDEVFQLCEKLGKKYTDEEFEKVQAQMDEDGSNAVDADEFVQWWSHHGGRKVPLPAGMAALVDKHAEVGLRGCRERGGASR